MKKIIMAGLIMVSGLMANSLDLSDNEFNKFLEDIVVTMNKELPKRMDGMSKLEKVTFSKKPLVLTYIIRFNEFSIDLPEGKKLNITYNYIIDNKDKFKKGFDIELFKLGCENKMMRDLVKDGVSIKRVYFWENETELFTQELSNEDCVKGGL